MTERNPRNADVRSVTFQSYLDCIWGGRVPECASKEIPDVAQKSKHAAEDQDKIIQKAEDQASRLMTPSRIRAQ